MDITVNNLLSMGHSNTAIQEFTRLSRIVCTDDSERDRHNEIPHLRKVPSERPNAASFSAKATPVCSVDVELQDRLNHLSYFELRGMILRQSTETNPYGSVYFPWRSCLFLMAIAVLR